MRRIAKSLRTIGVVYGSEDNQGKAVLNAWRAISPLKSTDCRISVQLNVANKTQPFSGVADSFVDIL